MSVYKPMNAQEFKRECLRLGACSEGLEWIEGKSLREFWDTCERADWMLWLCSHMVGKPGWPTRQELVLVACALAEIVLGIFEKKYPKDGRPPVISKDREAGGKTLFP